MKRHKIFHNNSLAVKVFEVLTWPWRAMPLGFHYFLGGCLSWFFRHVYHYRRDDVIINLSRSFPDKDYKEILKLTDGFYDHFSMILAETLWFGGSRLNRGRIRRSGIVSINNPEDICGAMEEGRSVMVLGSHLGNWELIGGMLEYISPEKLHSLNIGIDNVVVVYKKLESQFFDKFMGDSRTVLFNAFEGYVESSDSIFYAYDHRHEPKIYIFYTDQYPYRIATKHLLPTPFMHQKTLVMTGGAALAHKFRMSVWYMNVDRTRKGHYDVVFKPIADDASTMSPEAIMEKFYAYLENDIEANPSNYLWSHKRWKRKKSDRKFFETDENNKDESHE